MRRRRLGSCAASALALVLVAGCGKRVAPTAPLARLGPQVARVFPAARSAHILYNTAIWAEFKTDLDPASVNTQNVFLKVDTRRLPITVAWDATRKRITLTPTGLLALLRTHTVEFSGNLKTADGVPLGESWFWQFTTLGIRPPLSPVPGDRVAGESPFVSLSWLGTDPTVGAISYDVYAGTDSVAVATHAVPRAASQASTLYQPKQRWPQDGPLYWGVVTFNNTSAESLAGPVWRFDPLPGSTPIDTIFTTASDWFYGAITAGFFGSSYVSRCNADSIITGAADNFIRFPYTGLGPSLRLAGAMLELDAYRGYTADLSYASSMGLLASAGNVCSGSPPPVVLPRPGTTIVFAEVVPGNRYRYANDALTVQIESAVRRGERGGFTFAASRRLPLATFPVPAIKLFVYRPGGVAALPPR